MSIWTRIKSLFNKPETDKAPSHFEAYRRELNKKNLSSFEDLEKLVAPLIRQATKMEVLPPSRPPEDSQRISHFGGQPYFESGEEWPKSKEGKHMDFIFQVFNDGTNNLPANIKLVQLFYDWEEGPWDTEDDGWLVKLYENLDTDKMIKIDKPAELEVSKYCAIAFKTVPSLPDWEGIDRYSNEASKLSCILNEEEPWDSYRQAVEKRIGEQDYQSQIGGYPNWVQGESTPDKKDGAPMELLFQIDSEDNAGIMWGDVGLVYAFYDPASKQVEFTLQCH